MVQVGLDTLCTPTDGSSQVHKYVTLDLSPLHFYVKSQKLNDVLAYSATLIGRMIDFQC